MNITEKTLTCSLFMNIEKNQLASLLNCLSAVTRTYKKDAFIFRAGDEAVPVGIVMAGGVHVVQEDFWGHRSILAHVQAGDVFAEAFSCTAKRLPVSIVASEDAEIMLINYRKIVTTCSTACLFHARLVMNMMRTLAEKNTLLMQKIEHLSKRTTQEKLFSFLSAKALIARSDTLEIPFNRQELADYLCVDRSALSRELGAMQEAGLLRYEKNTFTLLRGKAPWT